MKIAAVIVTHNRLNMLRQTLPKTLNEPFDHVILVDNASSDGTDAFLNGLIDPKIKVLRLPVNIGGAGGFAKGISFALTFEPDWIALFDDDAFPQTGALTAFEMHVPRIPNLGAIASRVETENGNIHPLNRPTRVPFLSCKSFGQWLMGKTRIPSTAGEIDTFSFVGCFLNAAAIKNQSLPDARLFIGGDDTAYALNLRRAGLRSYFLPQVRFTHLGPTGDPSLERAFYSARNKTLLCLDVLPIPLVPFALARHVLKTRARTSPTRRTAVTQAIWHGIKVGIKGRHAYRSGAPLPK